MHSRYGEIASPNILLRFFTPAVAVKYVNDTNLLKLGGRELPDWHVYNLAIHARGQLPEHASGRLCSNVEDVVFDGIVKRSHKQTFGFAFSQLVVAIAPHVTKAAWRQGHQ